MTSSSLAIPESLMKLGKKCSFRNGQPLLKSTAPLSECFFIVSGMVKVYIDHENGRRSTLDFVTHDDWLGELSVFTPETHIKSTKALSDILCLAFNIEALQRLCTQDNEVSLYFNHYMARKLLIRTFRMSLYMNYPLEKTLADFIINHRIDHRFTLPLTEVSEYMNVSYRHILHVMRQFCDEGILVKDKGYHIADMSALTKMAKPRVR